MRALMAMTVAAVLATAMLGACGGADGAAGPAGATGATGAQGAVGAAGAAGADGTNGTNGTDGATGPAGEAGAAPSYAIPSAGLVGYYRGAGIDLSGGGHDAIATGVTTVADRFGAAGMAAHFDGTLPAYLLVANDTALPIGAAPRAVSLWFRTPGSHGGEAIFNWGTAEPGQRFSQLVEPLPGGQDYFAGQNADLAGRTPLTDGDWHHLVVDFDGVTAAVYFDAVLSVAGPLTLDTTGQDLYFGVSVNPTLGTEPFTGDIDSMRIYDRVLTHEERDALFREDGWH